MGMVVISCCKDDDPVPVTFSLTTEEIILSSEKGSSKTFELSISEDASWSIQTTPFFVDVTPSSGNGSAIIKVTAKENNDSDEAYEDNITIKVNGAEPATKSLKVIQRCLEGCYAEVSKPLLLCDGFANIFTCGNNTKYFYQKLYRKDVIDKMSENEIIADVITGKIEDRESPDPNNSYCWYHLNENYNYILVTIAFAENDRMGKVVRYPFTTKNSEVEPAVDVTDLYIDWDKEAYEWSVSKNTYCSSYYTYAAASKYYMPTYSWMEEGASALLAWAIRSEIEKNANNHVTTINQETWALWGNEYSSYTATERFYASQLNDGTTSFSSNIYTDNYLQIVIWGTKNDGELSGVLSGGFVDMSPSDKTYVNSNSSSKIKLMSKPSDFSPKEDRDPVCVKMNINDIQLIRLN